MASLPRRNVPPPMSTTASGSNNAVMPVTSPAFSLSTNNRSKSWGSLAGCLVVKSYIAILRQLLWVALLRTNTKKRNSAVVADQDDVAGRVAARHYQLVEVGWP